jgi:hypothetical protein
MKTDCLNVLPLSLPPRGLSRDQAAEYCGCESLSAFSDWVRRKLIPGPMPGTTRWDRKAIDLALDRLSGLSRDGADMTFEEWERQHAPVQTLEEWERRNPEQGKVAKTSSVCIQKKPRPG